MTAREMIDRVDTLRPNACTDAEKLRWLRRLDEQVHAELLLTHEGAPAAPAAQYSGTSELLVAEKYGDELYSAYLSAQIDFANGEIERYNRSAALFSQAWRQLADSINREREPLGALRFRM